MKNLVRQWGPADSGNGQFNHTRSIAIDEDKLQVVTNIGNHRIEKLDMNGNFIVTIKIPSKYGGEKSCKNAT